MLKQLNQNLIYEIRHRSGLTNPYRIVKMILPMFDKDVKESDRINVIMSNLHFYNEGIHRFKVWE